MQTEVIIITIVASLVSGLLGVFISFKFYERLEKRKLKTETAKKLIGYRFKMSSIEFQTAMNEIFVVFADSKEVMVALKSFWEVLETPRNQRSESLTDDKLLTLLKAVCIDAGVIHKGELNDSFFMRFFNVPEMK